MTTCQCAARHAGYGGRRPSASAADLIAQHTFDNCASRGAKACPALPARRYVDCLDDAIAGSAAGSARLRHRIRRRSLGAICAGAAGESDNNRSRQNEFQPFIRHA
jgi:hypothetical protein